MVVVSRNTKNVVGVTIGIVTVLIIFLITFMFNTASSFRLLTQHFFWGIRKSAYLNQMCLGSMNKCYKRAAI